MKKLLALGIGVLMVLGLCACSADIGTIQNADKYTAGNAVIKETVENLQIDWASGEVNLVIGDENAVVLTEEYAGEIPEEEQMHWYLDGTTLKVRYSMSLGLNTKQKRLTVQVPKTLCLKYLEVDVASASVNAENVSAEEVDMDTASGDVKAAFTEAVKNASFDAASGKVEAAFEKSVGQIEIDTASGNVLLDTKDEVEKLDVDTSSGDVKAGFDHAPGTMKINTASGDVELQLPENADFTLDVDTASGSFDSEVQLTVGNDRYVSGKGTAAAVIDTASGDIQIRKR